MNQQPGYYRHALGEWTVTPLNDGTLELPLEALTGIDAGEAVALLRAAFRPTPIRATINGFLLQGRGRTVLVDAGGRGYAPTAGHLVANLRAAGVEPAAVDAVLMTHLHPDHFGALAEEGAAAFPNAELVIAEAEAAHWLGAEALAAAPEGFRPFFEKAQAAVHPYAERTRLLSGGDVLPGVTMVPLPGHTPGHCGYRVEDGAHALLLWGDVMHVPEVQAPRPEATVAFDTDPAQAAATRRRVLDAAVADRMLIAGAHLHFPTLNHVVADGDGCRLVPMVWSPVP